MLSGCGWEVQKFREMWIVLRYSTLNVPYDFENYDKILCPKCQLFHLLQLMDRGKHETLQDFSFKIYPKISSLEFSFEGLSHIYV